MSAASQGNAYYKSVSQFDLGEYTGSNNKQDDIAVMSSYLPLIPQENGVSMSTATPLTAAADPTTGLATAKASGVVTNSSGDWFTFTAAAGTATLSAAVTAPMAGTINRANLDILLTVYDAAGTAIAAINPPGADPVNGLGVPPTAVTLPAAGAYYVAVTGAGGSGYSNYGSRGQFELTVAFPAPAQPSPSPSPVPEIPSPSPVPEIPSPSPVPEVPSSSPVPEIPSPSPVPEIPSPSPVPEIPSPSPSPAPQEPISAPKATPMVVSRIAISKVYLPGKASLYCQITVTVRSRGGQALSGARVFAGWASTPTPSQFTSSVDGIVTGGLGMVAHRSSTMTVAGARGCEFTVSDVQLDGYRLDRSKSVMSRRLSW